MSHLPPNGYNYLNPQPPAPAPHWRMNRSNQPGVATAAGFAQPAQTTYPPPPQPPIVHAPFPAPGSASYPYALAPLGPGQQPISYPAALRLEAQFAGHAAQFPGDMAAAQALPVVAPLNQTAYASVTRNQNPDVNQRPVIPPFGTGPVIPPFGSVPPPPTTTSTNSSPAPTPRPKTRNPHLATGNDPMATALANQPPIFGFGSTNAPAHPPHIPQIPQPKPNIGTSSTSQPVQAQFNRGRRPQTPFEQSPYYKPLREGESLLLTPFHPKGAPAPVPSTHLAGIDHDDDSDSDSEGEDECLNYGYATVTYPGASSSSRR